MSEKVAHLVFDVESISDGDLISKVRYPEQDLTPREAIATYQDEFWIFGGIGSYKTQV